MKQLKPGEIAVTLWTSTFWVPGSSLVPMLYNLQIGKPRREDMLQLIHPGVIDAIVYHDRFVVEQPWTVEELESARAPSYRRRDFEMLMALQDWNIARIVDGESLKFPIETRLRLYANLYAMVGYDPRYSCLEILSDPFRYWKYLKRNGLLRDLETSLVESIKITPDVSIRRWMITHDFLRKVNVEELYKAILRSDPVKDIRIAPYAYSMIYRCPTLSYDTTVDGNMPEPSVVQVTNAIMNRWLADATQRILEKMDNVRKDLTKTLRTGASHLFRLDENDVEMPLTLAIALDRIKEKKVTPLLLWDSLRALHNDRSTVRFRDFLKGLEVAVQSQNREQILKAERDVNYAAKQLVEEYSTRKALETRHFTKVPSFILSLVLQQYDKIVRLLAEKAIEHMPSIGDKFGFNAHIKYMTALGRAGIKSRSIKNVLSKRLGNLGQEMAERYIYMGAHSDVAKEMLDYARESKPPSVNLRVHRRRVQEVVNEVKAGIQRSAQEENG